ncbi:MAG: Ca-activated chloride channel family protein [Myxococcota bacterium]|jgi:Ca-activated chloride channel family protein
MLAWMLLPVALAITPAPDDRPSLPPPTLSGEAGALVLEHVGVSAEVQAGLAVVEVTHTFRNPFPGAIDATYVFPLPTDAAVRHMELVAGDLLLSARIDTRDAARQAYERARQEGRKASLLEQQRNNVFTQEVSAICAGETVHVTVEYVQQVPYEDGVYTFALPTTMGERYAPGDLDEPPLISSTGPGRDLEVLLSIDEGLPVGSLWSDTHALRVLEEDSLGTVLDLGAAQEEQPNRDVVVEWTLHGDAPRGAFLVSPDAEGDDGTFALTLEPHILEDLAQQRKRELLFVLDSSCSMLGAPWGAAVATVNLALEEMEPYDTFNLVKFSDAAGSLFDEPKPATPPNVRAAQAWLGRFEGGGTRMDAGLVHALDMPGDAEALRLVLLLTDGFIGNEDEMFEVVEAHLGDARLFSLGVGSSVNRYLLEGLARVGRGDVTYQLFDTPTEVTVDTFYHRIAHPSMTDIEVDFGDMEVWDVTPGRIADLWVGQPLRVVGRYRGTGPQHVTVHGRVGGEDYALRLPVDLDAAETHEAVPVLWARTRIAELSEARRQGDAGADEAITEIALAHHLVSEFTSLVATAESPSACAVGSATVDVQVLAPLDTVFMPEAGGLGTQIGVVGGLVGAKGVAMGAGGLGSRGVGAGGGGTGRGLVAGSGACCSGAGVAGRGTRGVGSGASGYGGGGGTFGSAASAVSVSSAEPVVLGSLDKTLIQQVIKRHMNQLRYCYLRELQKDPKLEGKVVVKMVIAADGTVSQADIKSTTLGNEAVESCVQQRFERMQFPAPGGGGIGIVSYPLVFENSD